MNGLHLGDRSEEVELKLTTSQAKQIEEVLRGYIEGQMKKYTKKHWDKVYDLNPAQIAGRICDGSNPNYFKLTRVIEGYTRIVRQFELEDVLEITEL